MTQNLFIITSAINAKRSVFSREERIFQTRKTVESIISKDPTASLVMVESTSEDSEVEDIWSKIGVPIINIRNQKLLELSEAKLHSPAEALSMLTAINYLEKDGRLDQFSRIFKISGRYRLSQGFDIDVYNNPDMVGKFVFLKRLESWQDEMRRGVTGADHLLSTRLWSMDRNLVSVYLGFIERVFNDCLSFGIDLEHSMWKHIPKDNLFELPRTFVEGELSACGETISD